MWMLQSRFFIFLEGLYTTLFQNQYRCCILCNGCCNSAKSCKKRGGFVIRWFWVNLQTVRRIVDQRMFVSVHLFVYRKRPGPSASLALSTGLDRNWNLLQTRNRSSKSSHRKHCTDRTRYRVSHRPEWAGKSALKEESRAEFSFDCAGFERR